MQIENYCNNRKYTYCLCLSGEVGEYVFNDIQPLNLNIKAILTDLGSKGVISMANAMGIPLFIGNPRKKDATKWAKDENIMFDFLLSINYLFILDGKFLDLAKKAINFHDSLLPRYRGRCPNVWSIINGERYTGLTAHLMNTECDDGDIVCQEKFRIKADDTGGTIREKTKCLYIKLINQIIQNLESGTLTSKPQNKEEATYYGKRTPADGHINWNWQKERINNWIRAQAAPYPGAFAFIGKQKVVINRISFSRHGYIDTVHDGTIIGIEKGNPVVKTQNGAIVLLQYNEFEFKIGDRLT